LLVEAVNTPGVLSSAYEAFWNYSIGNQLIALFECHRRGMAPGPIHTFKGWIKLGRQVRRGEKAIELCMPVSWAVKADPQPRSQPDEQAAEPVLVRRRFIFKPHWFVLAQTDGSEYVPLAIPAWEETLALSTLLMEKIPFTLVNGNAQGYAQARQVAVSPVAHLPHRTLIHEIAHIVLGHTTEIASLVDHEERTPRELREVEAESVAYLVTQSLGLPGEAFSRGYLQHWLAGEQISERSAHKIFHAADQILKAGRPKPIDEPSHA
jgi:antirestriction protein ArdC